MAIEGVGTTPGGNGAHADHGGRATSTHLKDVSDGIGAVTSIHAQERRLTTIGDRHTIEVGPCIPDPEIATGAADRIREDAPARHQQQVIRGQSACSKVNPPGSAIVGCPNGAALDNDGIAVGPIAVADARVAEPARYLGAIGENHRVIEGVRGRTHKQGAAVGNRAVVDNHRVGIAANAKRHRPLV